MEEMDKCTNVARFSPFSHTACSGHRLFLQLKINNDSWLFAYAYTCVHAWHCPYIYSCMHGSVSCMCACTHGICTCTHSKCACIHSKWACIHSKCACIHDWSRMPQSDFLVVESYQPWCAYTQDWCAYTQDWILCISWREELSFTTAKISRLITIV
jgi:hypothetical protein